MRSLTGTCLLAVPFLLSPAAAANKDPAPLLARIKAVRGQGAGNAEAAAVMAPEVVSRGCRRVHF